MSQRYEGGCACGAVRLEVEAPTIAQGFCHCGSCRSWSGTPVTAYALFPAGQVRVTAGADHLAGHRNPGSGTERVRCAVCGGAIMARNDARGFIDVFPPVLRGFPFTPAAHVNYAERMINMKDGLPKFGGMPGPGGDGELVDE